jgi:hypothetical protein
MGPARRTLVGHWRQELTDLQTGLAKLEQKRKEYQKPDSMQPAPLYKAATNIDYLKFFQVTHQPVTAAIPGTPLTIRIKVQANDGLKWVRLLYRDVNQYEDFKTLDMKPSKQKDEFEATIPGEEIKSKWDLMYLVEMMGKKKNGAIYPDLNKQTPYVVVKVAH